MKNEARGFCGGGIDSFFRMKYRDFITMQWHLPMAVLPEWVVVSWLKGGICLIPGKAAWHHIGGEFGPAQLRRDRRAGSVPHQELLLLCP